MKKHIKILVYFSLMICCFSCSPRFLLREKTDRLIEKSFRYSDTIFKYYVAFNDFNLIWYHDGDSIFKYRITPYKIKKYKPIIAKNIFVSDSSINKCFDSSIFKDIQCFNQVLDGESIMLYIKGKRKLVSSIDTECLYNSKFEANSIQFKIQYDFSKVFKPLNFERLYPELE